MSIETELQSRSGSTCELCGAYSSLKTYEVPPHSSDTAEACVLTCTTCHDQIISDAPLDAHHWRCLNESMWSQIPAVQVMAWRLLTRLGATEDWARDLVDMLYLEDETLAWAKAGSADNDIDADDVSVKHVDSNGALLNVGDTITLTKDLTVKGAGFTAKHGTAVTNISLVRDNAGQIEGRVNGQQIVILTRFVKKSA